MKEVYPRHERTISTSRCCSVCNECRCEECNIKIDVLLQNTYFGGDTSSPCDNKARELWLNFLLFVRAPPFDAEDNVWEISATGPCCPCTEIHYERIGGGRDASKMVNADLPNVIEIWSNAFIQYNREADKSLRPLPQQHHFHLTEC